MELKHLSSKQMTMREVSFNRTFMELKLSCDTDFSFASTSFNRTFMELKHLRA